MIRFQWSPLSWCSRALEKGIAYNKIYGVRRKPDSPSSPYSDFSHGTHIVYLHFNFLKVVLITKIILELTLIGINFLLRTLFKIWTTCTLSISKITLRYENSGSKSNPDHPEPPKTRPIRRSRCQCSRNDSQATNHCYLYQSHPHKPYWCSYEVPHPYWSWFNSKVIVSNWWVFYLFERDNHI